jgi:hypothetical protein
VLHYPDGKSAEEVLGRASGEGEASDGGWNGVGWLSTMTSDHEMALKLIPKDQTMDVTRAGLSGELCAPQRTAAGSRQQAAGSRGCEPDASECVCDSITVR